MAVLQKLTDLLRSRADRERSGVPVYYIAFNILAIPGTDVRGLPLWERWELLGAALSDAEPPLQRVIATLDEGIAYLWFREMRAVGVEGIVAKALSSTYQAGETWALEEDQALRYPRRQDHRPIWPSGATTGSSCGVVRRANGEDLSSLDGDASTTSRRIGTRSPGRPDGISRSREGDGGHRASPGRSARDGRAPRDSQVRPYQVRGVRWWVPSRNHGRGERHGLWAREFPWVAHITLAAHTGPDSASAAPQSLLR
ncbi:MULTISPECIES: ATP-dependent DNA ligase [Streptomyces]|uniref:ATP-dependent DNA ligase n=1 Tax=Streptomyces TaxID=1883 RepID=UPI002F93B7BD